MAHETPLSRLENYQPTWVSYHHRYKKSLGSNPDLPSFGKPLDAKLLLEYQAVNNHNDKLLENYFVALGNAAFKDVVGELEPALIVIDIPIKHTQEVHPLQGYESD